MKLAQLKYLKTVVDNKLNISHASKVMYTSQPGVSKQIALLESELGFQIFERKGRHLSSITPIGEKIIDEANKMLEIENRIKAIASEYINPDSECLNIYTTNTIARFLLPKTISYFVKKYPKIPFHIGVAHPVEHENFSRLGPSDFSIVAHEIARNMNLIVLPAYEWSLSLVLPVNHPLHQEPLTLENIAQYPLISYCKSSSGRHVQDLAFGKANLKPSYFMTVMDTDVIKEYVSMNMGVGIIATIAAESICDDNVVSISLSGLMENAKAWLCFGRNVYFRKHMYDFIETFSPHLTRDIMETVTKLSNKEIDSLSENFRLPLY